MARMTYVEQLKHPNWQRRRLERLSAANWECVECGTREVTLHVHHKRYMKGRMAWEYDDSELDVLCEDCHGTAHYIESEINELLIRSYLPESMALLGGFNCQNDELDPDLIYRVSNVDPLTFHVGACALLLQFLGIQDIAKVARYAASLTRKNSEAHPICEKWFSKFDQ